MFEMSKKLLSKKKRKILYFFLVYFIVVISLIIFFEQTEFYRCFSNQASTQCFFKFFNYWFQQLQGKCPINKIDSKGITNESYTIFVDVYLLDSDRNESWVNEILNGTNKIWNEYGIYIYLRNVTSLKLSENLVVSCPEIENFLSTNLTNRLYDNIPDIFIARKLLIKRRLIFWDFHTEAMEGQGLKSVCNIKNVNVIWISSNVKNVSWNLAHEMGHILGLIDKTYFFGEFNMMTNSGCIKANYFPTILNQEQVNIVISTAKSLKF